jgi:dihydroorotate dehydrogenase (NAD+) catalytic subunit
MADLKVHIKDLVLKNPVTLASGTCGYGTELKDFFDIGLVGGIFLKGITPLNRDGNPYPRMAETPSGMLNSVGLQNRGVDYFIREIYPLIRDAGTHLIPNINGSTVEEYAGIASKLNDLEDLPAIELNISCPNVAEGGMLFGVCPRSAEAVTRAVRKAWERVLIVKLTPNVTDITEIARAVEDAGADSVSLINTLLGMSIDAETRKPSLSTVTGGLSGPAVKPVALRMVWQVSKAVHLPIFGIGGIMNARDAIEFLLAGATAVQVGTATFIDPLSALHIIEGVDDYLERHHIASVSDLVGKLGDL